MSTRNRIFRRSIILAVCAIALVSAPALAQLPVTRLQFVSPSGANAGKTVDVKLGGEFLDEVNQLQFSHAGITAKQKMAEPGPFDKGPVPITNEFTVKVAGNVPPGIYEARAAGTYGISNARAFVISDLPVAQETEPNNKKDEATEIALPIAVSGQANRATDVDCFKFTSTANQRILIDCHARRIDSRMDAVVAVYDTAGRELGSSRDSHEGDPLIDFTVPANGDYFIRVHDAIYRGNTLAAGEVKEAHFYQLRVGALPHIDFIFPPAGIAGRNNAVTVYGRNLPGGQAAGLTLGGKPLQKLSVSIPLPGGALAENLTLNSLVQPESAGLDGKEYRIKGASGLSNPVLFGVATAPVVVEKEPNSTVDKPQVLTVPCEVVGQFYPQLDKDWFAFEAKKDEVYSVDLISQRFGLPTDPSFIVQQVTKNDKGEEQVRLLATIDDSGSPHGGGEFDIRTDDPFYRLVAPVDATYRVMIRDSYSALRDDPRSIYRLSIRKEQPDFRLAAVPVDPSGGLLLRKGGNAAIRVVAFRRDNFAEQINLSIKGLPAGVTCSGATIGPARNSATLVLTAADSAAANFAQVQVFGTAKIGNATVTRPARFGSVISPLPPRANNQAQLPGESRLTQNLAIAVTAGETAPVTLTAGGGKVFETSRAGIVKIPYTCVRRNNFKGNVVATPSELPANIDGKAFTINGNATAGEFQINLKPNTPVGTYTFYVNGFAQNVSYSRNPAASKAAAERKKELDKINTDCIAAAKTATTAKTAADKLATDTAAAEKASTDKKAAADKAATDAAAVLTAATAKVAAAKAALAKTPGDANLTAAVTAAEKVVTDATAKAKAATDAVAVAQKALVDATAKAKAAADAKVVTDKAKLEADEKAKAAATAKAEADKRAADTAAKAKAANRNIHVPSTSVTLKIAPAPITMAAKAPATPLKQGEKLEVPITIQRLFSYADAVTVSAVLPGGVGGLSIPNATIAKGQAQTKLTITAAANATPGQHQLIIRATLKLNNQNLTVDQPIALTVQKVDPPAKK